MILLASVLLIWRIKVEVRYTIKFPSGPRIVSPFSLIMSKSVAYIFNFFSEPLDLDVVWFLGEFFLTFVVASKVKRGSGALLLGNDDSILSSIHKWSYLITELSILFTYSLENSGS